MPTDKGAAVAAEGVRAVNAHVDDIQHDLKDARKQVLSRWRREAFIIINDVLMQLILEVDDIIQTPLLRLDSFIMKVWTRNEASKVNGLGKLGALVCGKADTIQKMYSELLWNTEKWEPLLTAAAAMGGSPHASSGVR